MQEEEKTEMKTHLIFSTEHSAWLNSKIQPTEKISEAHKMSQNDALQVHALNPRLIAIPISILCEDVKVVIEEQEPVVV